MTILAIDQGTTSTRAIAVKADGTTTLLYSAQHRQSYPAPGHVEQDPEEILGHLRACLAAAEGHGIRAVGLANQGESCLAWEATTGRPVSPILTWQDSRTAAMLAGIDPAPIMERAGLPPDPYFPASKFAWILAHIPEATTLAAQGRLRLGTTDAWFRQRLTGRFQTDVTTAARTSLMNLATREWDAELCRIFGVPMAALPAITPSTGDLGTMAGLPLRASLVDQQAALYGHGCREPGAAKITFGTGAFVLAVTDGLRRTSGPLPTIAWQRQDEPPTFALDAGVTAAASAVDWARGLGLFDGFDQLEGFGAPAIDRGIVFVPALAGLGAPHWDRAARGGWSGLSLGEGPRDMMQAVLEGIAFRVAEAVQSIAAIQPLTGAIPVDGGLAANRYLVQFLADLLNRPLRLTTQTEQTAMGVAMLASEAIGAPIQPQPEGRMVTPRDHRPERLAQFAKVRRAMQRLTERAITPPPEPPPLTERAPPPSQDPVRDP